MASRNGQAARQREGRTQHEWVWASRSQHATQACQSCSVSSCATSACRHAGEQSLVPGLEV